MANEAMTNDRAPRNATALAVTCLVALVTARQALSEPTSNLVLRWNQVAIQAIIDTRTTPPVAARAFAILHTCIFDAWAVYEDGVIGTQLGVVLTRAPVNRLAIDRATTISYAAYHALIDLFPSQQDTLLDPLMMQLGYDPTDQTADAGRPGALGNLVCQRILDRRHNDGSNQLGNLHPGAYSDYTGYAPSNSPALLSDFNHWQPLVVNGVRQSWQLPQWRRVTPFALESGAQFRSMMSIPGPVRFGSTTFRAQTDEVIHLSAALNDRNKVIAEYWADGASTATPPGHWNLIAQWVSRRDHHTLEQDAKLFFVLGNALLDTSIAAWDTKMYTDAIRPVTVIRSLIGRQKIVAWAGPGLGTRSIDCKDFRSYLPTPPFSSYVSGHSAFSAAAAEILTRYTGSAEYGASYTAAPGTSIIERGLTPSAPVTLSWATFSAAADEAGMSRRFGGIHFENDDLAGRQLGRAVAAVVWERAAIYLQGGLP